MEMIYNFSPDGTLSGLWNDLLSSVDGNKAIERASNVEFNMNHQGWIVTIEIGEYAGCCLPMIFPERSKAIEAEVEFFNEYLINGERII
jgi:hypothetical protein